MEDFSPMSITPVETIILVEPMADMDIANIIVEITEYDKIIEELQIWIRDFFNCTRRKMMLLLWNLYFVYRE